MSVINKYVFVIFLMLFCESLFSQEQNNVFDIKSENTKQKQALFIDLFPLMEGVWEGKVGGGLFYERRMYKYFSFVGEMNFYTDFDDESVYSFAGHSRFYPFQTTIGKLFVNIGLGYRYSTLINREKNSLINDNIQCLVFFASTGWKFIIGKGFIIEPSIGYRQNIFTFTGHEAQSGGITLNVGIGWAF